MLQEPQYIYTYIYVENVYFIRDLRCEHKFIVMACQRKYGEAGFSSEGVRNCLHTCGLCIMLGTFSTYTFSRAFNN